MKYFIRLLVEVKIEATSEIAAEKVAWSERDSLKKIGYVTAVEYIRKE